MCFPRWAVDIRLVLLTLTGSYSESGSHLFSLQGQGQLRKATRFWTVQWISMSHFSPPQTRNRWDWPGAPTWGPSSLPHVLVQSAWDGKWRKSGENSLLWSQWEVARQNHLLCKFNPLMDRSCKNREALSALNTSHKTPQIFYWILVSVRAPSELHSKTRDCLIFGNGCHISYRTYGERIIVFPLEKYILNSSPSLQILAENSQTTWWSLGLGFI